MTNRFFAAAALALLAATPVFAAGVPGPAAVTTTLSVPTGDLDLRTDAGDATLRHRVRVAAHKVCGEAARMGDPDYDSYASCVEQAEQTALATSDTLIASVRSGIRFALNQPAR
jgi:UrcA family protein